MPDFRREIEDLINRHSKERGSNTPDFILAGYLEDCLRAFDSAVKAREGWYNSAVRAGTTVRSRCGRTGGRMPTKLEALVERLKEDMLEAPGIKWQPAVQAARVIEALMDPVCECGKTFDTPIAPMSPADHTFKYDHDATLARAEREVER